MQRLNDMPTSELVNLSRNYASSISEIGIYSELVKEITTRLSANTAAAEHAIKLNEELTAALREKTRQCDVLAVENALTNGCGFFAYDPDNGFEEFKTREEAIAAAESYIDYYRNDAGDGWADEVSQVSWGIVRQESTKVDERPKTDEDSVSDHIETVCDFALLPVITTPDTDAYLADVKAQGVDEFAQQFCENASMDLAGNRGFYNGALEFAAQLRKGVADEQ